MEDALVGKRVLVVGLGRSGGAAVRLCAARGARVTVTDNRGAEQLGAAVTGLPADTTLELGGHPLAAFVAQDLIVVSPGVPPLPELSAARAAGVPIIGELELASRYIQAPIVAITGTNGKSTTTTLCGQMLTASKRPTFIGGNLGVPLAEAVGTPAAGPDGVCVVEVSSFQLETIEGFHARVAVLLNISPDHLDRYSDIAGYVAAKARVFENQTASDFAVVNVDDTAVETVSRSVRATVVPLSTARVLRDGGWIEDGVLSLRLPGGAVERYASPMPGLIGRHNQENALAAALSARLLGTSAGDVEQTLSTFRALAHRMELVSEASGVLFFDDSKGTNVGAVVAALTDFPRRVVLIAGGRDKGGSYEPLAGALKRVGRGAVLIGEAAPRMREALEGVIPVELATTMESAVFRAAAMARPGDAVVLSPACSSFDMFRSYEHRAQAFRSAVRRLVGDVTPIPEEEKTR